MTRVPGRQGVGTVLLLAGSAFALLAPMEGEGQEFAGLVDVGGRSLWAECRGTGSPAVLLEAGAGNSSGSWGSVWDSLTTLTRTCRYDRAGLGRSPVAPHSMPPGVSEPVTDVVADLEALVAALGIGHSMVMVGHSAGALYVRLYAARHPGRVRGLVFVDGLEEGQRGRVLDLPAPASPDDARAWSAYVDEQRRRQVRTTDGEDAVVAAMRPARDLGDLPVEVLSASDPMGPPPEGFARGMIDQMAEAWRQGQVLLAGMSTEARWTVVPGTGHNLHRQRPDVVVAAVRRLLRPTR